MNPRFYRNALQKKTHPKVQPEGNDPLEIRAADIAQRCGDSHVKNDHRKAAHREMQQTSPEVPDDEPPSH